MGEIIAWIFMIIMVGDPIVVILIGIKKREYAITASMLSRGYPIPMFFGWVFSIIFRKQIYNDMYNKEFYKFGLTRDELNKLFKKNRVIRYGKRAYLLECFALYIEADFDISKLKKGPQFTVKYYTPFFTELKMKYCGEQM